MAQGLLSMESRRAVAQANIHGAQRTPCPPRQSANRRTNLIHASKSSGFAPTEPAPKKDPGQQPPTVTLDDTRTRTLLDWARGPASIRLGPLRPATFGGMRGLAASSDIAPEALLIEVPRRSALVLAPKQRNACPDLASDKWWKAAPWFAKMGLMLAWHARRGPASPLGPWAAALPAREAVAAAMPVFWEEAQLRQLQYPRLIELVREQRAEWAALYDSLAAAPPAAPAAPPSPPVSREEFYWAMGLVRSRTFSGPYIGSTLQDRLRLGGTVGALVVANTLLGLAEPATTASAALAALLFNLIYELALSRSLKQYALCPVIDLFNHSSAVQSEVSYNYFGDSYEVVASRALARGEQVFISYGSQSNDSLQQYYGFTERDNPADTYVVADLAARLGEAAEAAGDRPTGQAALAARLAALRGSSLAPALKQVTVQRAGFPAEALQAARFLAAAQAEAEAGVAAFAKPGSPELEGAAAELLAGAVRAELAALGSSLEADEAALAAGAAGGGAGGKKAAAGGAEAAALAFRVEKKRLLRGVLRGMGAE